MLGNPDEYIDGNCPNRSQRRGFSALPGGSADCRLTCTFTARDPVPIPADIRLSGAFRAHFVPKPCPLPSPWRMCHACAMGGLAGIFSVRCPRSKSRSSMSAPRPRRSAARSEGKVRPRRGRVGPNTASGMGKPQRSLLRGEIEQGARLAGVPDDGCAGGLQGVRLCRRQAVGASLQPVGDVERTGVPEQNHVRDSPW